MSETKFTKGEWEFLYEDDFVQVMVGNMTICYEPHPNSEELSNAHLIAAAPNLYHALKRTTEELAFAIDRYNKKVKDPAHFIDAETCHLNQIELAKARGEKC